MSAPLEVPYLRLGTYRHYKDKLYTVVGVALHSETHEPLVIYKSQYDSEAEYWVRPYDMFMDTVIVDGRSVPRFEFIGE